VPAERDPTGHCAHCQGLHQTIDQQAQTIDQQAQTIGRLQGEIARLRAHAWELAASAMERDHERPPHYL
jgi:uncharacterized coiled-coil protein SlyX